MKSKKPTKELINIQSIKKGAAAVRKIARLTSKGNALVEENEINKAVVIVGKAFIELCSIHNLWKHDSKDMTYYLVIDWHKQQQLMEKLEALAEKIYSIKSNKTN